MSDNAFKSAVLGILAFIAVTLIFMRIDVVQILKVLERAR